MNASRQPAGQPTGGQFAPGARADAGVGLEDPTAERDRRIRLLLGAEAGAPVSVQDESEYVEYECRCCGGYEDYVEVVAGDKSLRFEEMEHLEQQLAYADKPAQTEETLSPLLARSGTFHVRDGNNGEVKVFPGRLGNVRGHTTLIVTEASNLRKHGLGALGYNGHKSGDEYRIYARTEHVLDFEVDEGSAQCFYCKETVTTAEEIENTKCSGCSEKYKCVECGKFELLNAMKGVTGKCHPCGWNPELGKSIP